MSKDYDPEEPRKPKHMHGGGEWTVSGDVESSTPSSDNAVRHSFLQHLREIWPSLGNLVPPQLRRYHVIAANEIPGDSPKRPVPFLDSSGRPILDDQDEPILRPDDLPPEKYAQAGANSHLAEYIRQFKQLAQYDHNEPSEQNKQALGMLAVKISQELSAFTHGGSFDAERFGYSYVRDYRHYTSIATGVFMAAAGVRREDFLAIANDYADAFSAFHEETDEFYPHLAKRDVEDNLKGYDLYESGRIRQSRQ